MFSTGPTGGARPTLYRSHLAPLAAALLATLLVVGASLARPAPAAAASSDMKVVIVVGPVGSRTAEYIADANEIAAQARGYGARVIKVYSPYATWTRVKRVSRDANLFVYLGHGNGWPSPWGSFTRATKNGLGLNGGWGRGNNNTKYRGEKYIAEELQLAPRAVVLFHRLCYASGNSESTSSIPTQRVAHQRVDNFAAGFLRTGARAVFAEGWQSTKYILNGLFRTNLSMRQIFWSAPHAKRTWASWFTSIRTLGSRAILDPYYRGGYYRSVIGRLDMLASAWR